MADNGLFEFMEAFGNVNLELLTEKQLGVLKEVLESGVCQVKKEQERRLVR